MQSWECSTCTFRHQAHAPRCVMCNELRVSREQMRDFISGKTTATTAALTNQLQPSASILSHPLASIENVISNCKDATSGENVCTGNRKRAVPSTTGKGNSIATTNAPTTTTPTTQRPSQLAPLTRNPYNLKPLRLPNGTVPPITNAPTNPPPPPPPRVSPPITTVPPSNTTIKPNQSLHPPVLHDNSTATTLARNIAPSTIKKRPRTLGAGSHGKLIPSVSNNSTTQGRKRPKSLTKAIILPYQPGPVPLAMEYADTWIYPVVAAYPKRQYQYDIACAAIQQNTLVSLPTGLGKTLIAAVVLYNFYRWYPTGKVLFLAPTLPLVDQQVQACYEIMGIPASDTALLTGKVPAEQRTCIWRERRVFFCTPQTVQRDLEANRCDALKVVCVVLDEAHKSTGEYAYCKVISHLEQAGAKFRVVGLSATPGTSIKAIQQVIHVLRINRVEARSDHDPDVKQYIHDRQTDVVVVKGMDATKEVEHKLNEIIGPLLDILRKRNVILPQFTDHKAISSYTLLKCQSFITNQPQNQRDNAAIGYLSAGICFLQIRTDLHKHGIGTVRNKLLKLQMDRPRGPLATIVKGETFQALWDEVEKVSCNPNAVDNNLEDMYKNNPKLKKLCEILVDHFEKSKAASTSSRVIVFSQFRTSVSEIVDVLNESKPLIRARHFIGQGKSGASTKAAKTKSEGEPHQPPQLMDGMKQGEQKDVIERFKEGTYNTLVCTSIGEEGLDIGEVDLIVNFDCLSSPIRTIQRVGRTGRKREGRVVTLVAEGHEERTLAKSKQNEKTLIHALKDPNSFEVAPIAPMLPRQPAVFEQDMAIAKNFHMSQVDGAQKKLSKKRKPGAALRPWELNETEEFQRSCILGKLSNNPPMFDFEHLRRRFLNARLISLSYKSRHNVLRGRMSNLIKNIEFQYPINTMSLPSKNNSTLKHRDTGMDNFFPITNATHHLPVMQKYVKTSATTNGLQLLRSTSILLDTADTGASMGDSTSALTAKSSEYQRQPREIAGSLKNRTATESTEMASDTHIHEQTTRGTPTSSDIQTPCAATAVLIASENTGKALSTPSVHSNHILRSSTSRVRFSLDGCVLNETTLTLDSQQSFVVKSRKRNCRLAIEDSPEFAGSRLPVTSHLSKAEANLQDTPDVHSIDSYVCAICFTNDVSDENPIILCDGPGHDIECELVVHQNCYSAKCLTTDDKEWRCDRCQHISEGGCAELVKCSLCCSMDGVLKNTFNGRWEHFACLKGNATTRIQNNTPAKPDELNQSKQCTIPIHSNHSQSPGALLREKKYRRKLVMQKFIDYEAEHSDTDNNDELEEIQIREIEEEENKLAGSFINDTSQLGFSPDNLDALMSEQSQVNIDTTATTHRILDMEREKALQFATPLLNRRMMKRRDTDEGSYDSTGAPDSSTAPDSTHGLGNMNFVRSVLEHHRNGGSADEIEAFYQVCAVEQDQTVNQTNSPAPNNSLP